jgi:hypothetical protein
MAIDNLFVDDLTRSTPAELAEAIVGLARSGVEEKFRLDFKAVWQPEKQCPDVAALANSYGGLIIIGVSDDRQSFRGTLPPKHSDLKTQINNTIAACISPTPIFEVHTCPAPDDPTNRLVLIRVTPQPRIHLYLKTDRPVYIRSDDGSRPACAPQLQALLDRVRNADRSQLQEPNPLDAIAKDFYVTQAMNLATRRASLEPLADRTRSGASLQIGIVPERLCNLLIDGVLERQFTELIHAIYPSIGCRRDVDLGQTIMEYEDRRNVWFSFRHRDLDRDHELLWAFDSRGIVQSVFEVADRLGDGEANLWSIVDFFLSLDSTLRLAHEFWAHLGVFCGGRAAALLEVLQLTPFCSSGLHMPLFYETTLVVPEAVARFVPGPYPVTAGAAEATLIYDDLTTRRQQSVISLGGRLLRDLRFNIDAGGLAAALQEADRKSHELVDS